MKSYPSISKDVRHGVYIYAFDKLDGSNIRAEWSAKKGFHKFGSRSQLIDSSYFLLGESIGLIRSKYENALSEIFLKQKWQDVLCFFEFYGANSFAGMHFPEEHTVTLIDVNPYKQGILEPFSFIKHFGHLDIPKVLYEGTVSSELFDQVKNSTLAGMTLEGVVCKGANDKKTKMPVMFKIKSQAWLDKLKEHCKGDTDLFKKLA
jgi:hypothetical protein